jgi:outer membrane protein assembly factor BamB
MLEQRVVTRQAMRAPPKKSALEGTVNQAATAEIANELLNEMQRERGGSTVEEDQSRYQVTVRRGQAIQPWTGEVFGGPSFYALKTVDIIAAGKGLVALDKNNKKLWDAKLSFEVSGGGTFEALEDLQDADQAGLSNGAGPCIERGDVIYVYDQGMLTSFARANGNVKWRLPSVGIAGIWFDEQGMLYVNSTTASPDALKYTKQIDITKKIDSQVLKVDPETGKTLWAALNEGMVVYTWGKLVYTAEASPGDDSDEEDRILGVKTGLEIPAHIRLKRLDSGNGRVLWEHYKKGYPLQVHFDRNTIQLLFKKEVQNLHFIML